MTTFSATFAAQTQRGETKTFHLPAYSIECAMDDAGQWTIDGLNVREDDLIDQCRSATNWQTIRAAHFPMSGFHDRPPADQTPAHKSDY